MLTRILKLLRVEGDDRRGYESNKWINPDIAPLPPSRRTWGPWTFLGFGSIAKYDTFHAAFLLYCASLGTDRFYLVSAFRLGWQAHRCLPLGSPYRTQ